MRRRASWISLVALALAGVLACASGGPPPASGTARVFGTLRLVPHAGAPEPGGGGAYGSLRLRDAGLVDYSTPGFAVVFVDAGAKPGGSARVAIRDTHVEPRFEPDQLAIGAGGRIAIENASRVAHIFSYPAAGLVRRLAAGERIELDVPDVGEQGLFLLDVPDATATLFAAPGPFAVVSTAGAFELRNLAPGVLTLRAWHPRFPPAAQQIQLAPDTSVRVDFDMGVGIEPEAARR